MKRAFGSAVTALILGPCVAFSAVVAPEHVHEADAGHPHAVVHRHLQPHSAVSHDHDRARFDDDDEHVVWLDNVALHQHAFQFSPPGLPAAEPFGIVPSLARWNAPPDYDTAPAHGPPRTIVSSRAPPEPSRLT